MKVYLIVRPCSDSYYPGHPTGTAFLSEEKAQKFCAAENGDDLDDRYCYSVKEVEVVE